MAQIIYLKLKGTYDAALRDHDPARRHSKGYPFTQDPAAVKPVGVMPSHLGEADLHYMRLHYGPAFVPR